MPYSNALFFAGLSSLRARREQVARNFFKSTTQPTSHLHVTLNSYHDWEHLLNILVEAIGQKK